MPYIHRTEHYSASEIKEILIHALPWMSPEDTMLSEISHKMTHSTWFYLFEVQRLARFIGTEHRMAVARGWGRRREWRDTIWWARRLSLGRQKRSGAERGWWLHSNVNVLNATELHALKITVVILCYVYFTKIKKVLSYFTNWCYCTYVGPPLPLWEIFIYNWMGCLRARTWEKRSCSFWTLLKYFKWHYLFRNMKLCYVHFGLIIN